MKENSKSENKTNPAPAPRTQPQRRPDEVGSISVTGFVKIFDPNTKTVFVETRS